MLLPIVGEVTGLLIQSIQQAQADKRAKLESILEKIQQSQSTKTDAVREAMQQLRLSAIGNPQQQERLDRLSRSIDNYDEQLNSVTADTRGALSKAVNLKANQEEEMKLALNPDYTPDAKLMSTDEYNREADKNQNVVDNAFAFQSFNPVVPGGY